jgi:hypothetical protein
VPRISQRKQASLSTRSVEHRLHSRKLAKASRSGWRPD